MRQNKFIATKDHFVMLAASNETGDELWAGNLEYRQQQFEVQTTNAIGFLVRGSVNSFINNSNVGESWDHYSSAEAPLMLIREEFVDFGLVSTTDNTLFGAVIPKELIFSGQNDALVKENLSLQEKQELLDSSKEETIHINRKCKVYQKRDVNTFNGIEQKPLNIHTILDSEIQLDIGDE